MKRINGMKHLTATIILALSAVQMLTAQNPGRPAAPGSPAAAGQTLVPDSSFVVGTPAPDSTATAADGKLTATPTRITLIPYYAWCHRGPGRMQVWLAAGTEAMEEGL